MKKIEKKLVTLATVLPYNPEILILDDQDFLRNNNLDLSLILRKAGN